MTRPNISRKARSSENQQSTHYAVTTNHPTQYQGSFDMKFIMCHFVLIVNLRTRFKAGFGTRDDLRTHDFGEIVAKL